MVSTRTIQGLVAKKLGLSRNKVEELWNIRSRKMTAIHIVEDCLENLIQISNNSVRYVITFVVGK